MNCFIQRCLFLMSIVAVGCRHSGETLNTGKDLRQFAGTTTQLGGLPFGLTPASNGKYAIVCGMGYKESLYSIATSDGHIAGKVDYTNKAPPPSESDAPEVISDAASKQKNQRRLLRHRG